MYEHHGWIVLRYHTQDTNEFLQGESYSKFKKYLEEVDVGKLSNVKRQNGQDSWTISGLDKHYSDHVLDIFNWVAENLPGSYGLLYVHDDEDFEFEDKSNAFVVWKLARGKLTQEKDHFLSPYIPIVEDEYDISS
ncbi:Imm7 family immunity protein [Paenibacillus sp. BC26]|uniref:Imm7 family immunity protein n=1 Tax=Paenibacillus sp. BC26 TaxID=1881032 RepID=UPI0008ECB2DE|nr:Imm7 family immunity protein [Paenibacillus sp. BC26]SFT13442.1 Immunity protein 7 [Paenibacillus sp. BC26]